MNKKNNKNLNYIRLSEYKNFDYSIPQINLVFKIETQQVNVISEYLLIKNNSISNKLVLKGNNIKVINIFIDGIKLNKKKYKLEGNELIIYFIDKNRFLLKIESIIKPKENLSLLGMYESNGIITTQCEAEGFRRICFHPDRPDILSKYKVCIEADLDKYPILLSNGNVIKKSILKNNRHDIIWEDPFPKPSYLFALVAGNLKCVKDIFRTKSNKIVDINIYVERGDEDYVKHAIQSLKKAMSWDEQQYNLEYDLNLFNIVAIRHFNMGAMENKSLNIFNSKLVLANSKTSTDEELERIEGVVAHEYFHNWTGNRITCRDWFQLSLKEGLTVFRDQKFTSDIHNYQIKRIEDVKFLRKYQFKEDMGPTSHPVKPEKYLEIDNFYTTTIYEKGSEIIRMLETILTEEDFNKGFDYFISKYDGKAATIDDFVDSILRNSNSINLNQFKLWYEQNGTPDLIFKREWNKVNRKLTIYISQHNKNNSNVINKEPLIIPIKIAIFTEKNKYKHYKFILKDNKDKFVINNISTSLETPITSYLREFSAPVNWETDLNIDEQLFIMENEEDFFSIYDSAQRLYNLIISERLSERNNLEIENKFIDTIDFIIRNNKDINLSLLSELISIPNFSDIESNLNTIDPLKIYKVSENLISRFSTKLKDCLLTKLKFIDNNLYQNWPKGKDERKLIAVIWKLLLWSKDENIRREILEYIPSQNMTLSKSALNAFQSIECEERIKASQLFFERWKNNKIVLDNWFYFSASLETENTTDGIEKLFSHELFDPKSPNTLRSVLNGYVTNNRSFHSKDGKGYRYIAEKIIEFDKLNPIIISRFLKIFSRWNLYLEPYKTNMLSNLKYIDSNELSTNSREVINLILGK